MEEKEACSQSVELEVLMGLCHAYGSVTDSGQAVRSSLSWARSALGDVVSSAQIAVPDAAGRLRVVATDGPQIEIGRKRSARRRAAFEQKRPILIALRKVRGMSLLVLPLVSRGEGMGVMEIMAPSPALQNNVALEAIASQTAIAIRHIQERERLERRARVLADLVELTGELVSLGSPTAALERAVSVLHRRLRVPVAGWLSPAPGHPFEITASRGLRGTARKAIWEGLCLLPARSVPGAQEWREALERFEAPPECGQLTPIDAGEAILAIGGNLELVGGSLDPLASILRGVFDHLATVSLAINRNRHLETAIAWTAHEFRSPLAGTQATIEALLRKGPKSLEYQGLLSRSSEELRELGEMVDRLLRWSVGMSSLRRRRIDLVDLVKEVVASTPESEPDRIELSGPVSLPIRADVTHLRGAIDNIVRNSLRYAEPRTKIRVAMERLDGYALVRVADRGPSLTTSELKTIFDPFTQGGAGRRSRQGRGLGLFVAERVVRAHGGVIWAEAGPDGAVFQLLLPIDEENEREARPSAS